MPIRTRPKVKPKGARSNKAYDVSRYLGPGGPSVNYSRDGEQVTESIPKQIYRPAISLAGNISLVTLGTNAMDRNYGSVQAMQAVERHRDNGFIFADECPIGRNALHPDDEAALFADNPKPCTEHDFGWKAGEKYKPVELCPHLEKIRSVRSKEHTERMAKAKRISGQMMQSELIKSQQDIVKALQQVTGQQGSARARKSSGG